MFRVSGLITRLIEVGMRRWALTAVDIEPSNERFFFFHGGV
jgi:hypothetical protein